MTFKLGPNQEKWLRAAESGRHRQRRFSLEKDGAHCFLGLAKRVCRLKESSSARLFDSYRAVGLRSPTGTFFRRRVVVKGRRAAGSLMELNDAIGATFAEIAAFIRANPEVVFKESK